MNIEDYFYKTKFKSEIQDSIFSNLKNFIWQIGSRNSSWEVNDFDQNFIQKDSLLHSVHNTFKGRLHVFKFPPETNYVWHVDGINSFNINLIFKTQDSLTFFQKKQENFDLKDMHLALKPILTLNYEPCYWYLFNAQINHTIFNFSDEPRYLLSYNVFKKSNITYQEGLDFIKNL